MKCQESGHPKDLRSSPFRFGFHRSFHANLTIKMSLGWRYIFCLLIALIGIAAIEFLKADVDPNDRRYYPGLVSRNVIKIFNIF